MSDGFGLHAFDAEIVRHRVETGREHSEPAAQCISALLTLLHSVPWRRAYPKATGGDRKQLLLLDAMGFVEVSAAELRYVHDAGCDTTSLR
jgi:hypothetical protein